MSIISISYMTSLAKWSQTLTLVSKVLKHKFHGAPFTSKRARNLSIKLQHTKKMHNLTTKKKFVMVSNQWRLSESSKLTITGWRSTPYISNHFTLSRNRYSAITGTRPLKQSNWIILPMKYILFFSLSLIYCISRESVKKT